MEVMRELTKLRADVRALAGLPPEEETPEVEEVEPVSDPTPIADVEPTPEPEPAKKRSKKPDEDIEALGPLTRT